MKGDVLGKVEGAKYIPNPEEEYEAVALLVNGEKIGMCFPENYKVAAACIALLSNEFV